MPSLEAALGEEKPEEEPVRVNLSIKPDSR